MSNGMTSDLAGLVRKIIRKEQGGQTQYVQGTFVMAETLDANLSQVLVLDTTIRYVRKLAHVGTLSAGQSLLMIRGGAVPLTIIGVIVGDSKKATP